MIVCMAGDFVSPSLLSSFDRGHGMVDVMGASGITHVSLGNHETDIPMEGLAERIKESSFSWVNSNMRSLDTIIGVTTKEYEIMKFSSESGTHNRSVAILGLLSEVPSLYHDDSFGGATKQMEPVIDYTQRFLEERGGEVDLILPMTHQDVPIDKEMAKICPAEKIPVILGGHDHFVFDETVDGTRIFKTGMDAENIAVMDFVWHNEQQTSPEVSVELVNLDQFEPSPEIHERIKLHNKILDAVNSANIFRIDDYKIGGTFSTKNSRYYASGGCTMLASVLRQQLLADCAVFNGGGIKGNKDYANQEWYTLGNMREEFPYESPITLVNFPGKVIEKAITFSRRHSPQEEATGFLHACSAIDYDENEKRIISISNEAFDPDRLYKVACPIALLSGMDNNVPIVEWVKETGIEAHPDAGKPVKMAFIEYFALKIWLSAMPFEEYDLNYDGKISLEELKAHLAKRFGELMVDKFMKYADADHNGFISAAEYSVVRQKAKEHVDSNLMNQLSAGTRTNLVPDEALAAIQENDKKYSNVGNVSQYVKVARDSLKLSIAWVETQLAMLNDLAGMSDDEKEDLLFDMLDKDKDDQINARELTASFRASNAAMTFNQALERTTSYVAVYDGDDTVTLDREEFSNFLGRVTSEADSTFHEMCEYILMNVVFSSNRNTAKEEADAELMADEINETVRQKSTLFSALGDERMAALFNLFDQDGSGFVDFTEAAIGFYKIRDDLQKSTIDAMELMLMVDLDDNRTLDYNEFVRMILNVCSAEMVTFDVVADALTDAVASEIDIKGQDEIILALNEALYNVRKDDMDKAEITSALHYAKMLKLFDLWDTNNDGTLSYEEFTLGLRKYMKASNLVTMTEETLFDILQFDKNKNQRLEKEEFASLLIKLARKANVAFHEFVDTLAVLSVLRENDESEEEYIRNISAQASMQIQNAQDTSSNFVDLTLDPTENTKFQMEVVAKSVNALPAPTVKNNYDKKVTKDG
eukprot:CAMPEP_0194225346 /NCGR_PEP_ID=MMETSP0156-20130528/39400_1 /TAXON_ID=33649 /ORGANISM="Thalassionema nitzschioides, Strain L26-B" /LENGTH=988 /DNA_ID=CAMNT_0038957263 /DNA_START=101 /DNA_END=3063 /DNA_ORIENTATION=-